MGKKAPKASRKLAVKGGIKRQIQERHKRQKIKKQIDRRKNKKPGTVNSHPEDGSEVGDEEDEVVNRKRYDSLLRSYLKINNNAQKFQGDVRGRYLERSFYGR